MSFRPFTSESYAQNDRPEAWRDVLSAVGLQPASASVFYDGHATASHRNAVGVALTRISAGSQGISPLPQSGDGLPIALLPTEDGVVLRQGVSHRIIPAGHLLLLPRTGDWSVIFQRDMRAIVLSVTSEALHGRITGKSRFSEARVVAPGGLAEVFSRMLDATARTLETLADVEWAAVAQSLADLLLTFTHQLAGPASDASHTATQAAILHRICQTIERRLDDPDLAPARVAQAEGISERYLQKLFEGVGDNFTHYVRERRLQRAWADLSSPAEAHRSISEIAYRYGFGDSAHFSRTFRHRFGLPPREFRQQEAERAAPTSHASGQRGWPQDALAQLRAHPASGATPKLAALAAPGSDECRNEADQSHHHIAVEAARVHWGYFSRTLQPQAEISSGDTITIETLSQHASDDPDRMIAGDVGAENVFGWTKHQKNVDRRGAGPMDASVFGRGFLAGPKPREVVTIYEIFDAGEAPHARALYSYRWEPQTDPFGVVHTTYDYPGIPVASGSVKRRHGVLDGVSIPLRPHFGVIAVAPREHDFVDSIPPSYFGGNLDNWRLGKGSAVYLPVSVPGALLSVGDPHAAQGDGELSGTAIECSMTGTFQVILHKKGNLAGRPFADLSYPLIETETDWVLTGFSHPNYLAEFGAQGQSEVYATSSLDLAMKDAFRKMRRFLMNVKGLSEDEAIALMSAAVDFGVTQVVDGNWGVHAILSKRLFQDAP